VVGASQAGDARVDNRPPTLSLATGSETPSPARAGTSGRWAPMAPFEVGRFRVDQEVTLGAFGMTYAGVDTQAGRPVHVVVFHPGFFADPSRKKAQRERLERAQRYDHPNLAPTWAVGEAFGTMWVATAPTIGMPLTHWRRDAAALHLDEAYRLVGQLLDGVEAIHRAGGVHGALSPDTVRIVQGEVLITSPWWLEPVELPLDQLPAPRTAWLAPELQFGELAESPETDVYGVGLAFGFLLAGGLTEAGHSLGGLEWRDAQRPEAALAHMSSRDVETTAEDEAVPAFEVDGQFYPIDGGLSRARVARPSPQADAAHEGGRRGRRTPARTQVRGSTRPGFAPVVEVDFRRSQTLSATGLSGPDGLPVEPVPEEILRALLEAPAAPAPPPLPQGARPAERQPATRPWASTIEALDVGGPVLRLGAPAQAAELERVSAEQAPLSAPDRSAPTPEPRPANDVAENASDTPAPDESNAPPGEGGAPSPVEVATEPSSGQAPVYEPTVVEGIAPALLEMDVFAPTPNLPPIDPFAPPAPKPADPWADSPLAATGATASAQDELAAIFDAAAAPRTRPEQRPLGVVEAAFADAPPVPAQAGPVSRKTSRASARMPTLSFDARVLEGHAAPPPLPPPPDATRGDPTVGEAPDPRAMPSLAALLGVAGPAVAPPPLPGRAAPASGASRGDAALAGGDDESVTALLAKFDLDPTGSASAVAADAPLHGEPRTVRDPSGPIAGAGMSAEALATIPIRGSSLLVPAAAVRPPPARKPRTMWMALAALGVGAVATLVVVLALGSGSGGDAGGRGAVPVSAGAGGAGPSLAGGAHGAGGPGGPSGPSDPPGPAGPAGSGEGSLVVAAAIAESDATSGDTAGERADGKATEAALEALAADASNAARGEVGELEVSASAAPGVIEPDAVAAPTAETTSPSDVGPGPADSAVVAADGARVEDIADTTAAQVTPPGDVAAPGPEGVVPAVFTPKDPAALRCPDGMAKLKKKVQVTLADGAKAEDWDVTCIDRFEFPGAGAVPRTGIDLAGARAACAAKGKRLCTRSEWRRACGGTYPYGKEYDAERCNTAGADGTPRGLVAAGSKGKCMSPSGAFDMVGNVAEWTSDGTVNGGTSLKNGEDATCGSGSRRAGGAPHVGFRCCADAK